MRHELTVEAAFDASHLLLRDRFCPERVHGHTYDVKVTVAGDPDIDVAMMVADVRKVQDTLDTIVRELDLRHLNDMMGSAVTSVQGIAAWVFDRMLGHFSVQAVSVTCGHDRITAMVRKD